MKFPAQSILLIATRHIGDVLLTTPLLRSLRLAYPTARIDALAYTWTAGILDGNPDVNTVITVNQDPPFLEYAALVKKIFRRYDLAVSTLTSDRPILYAFWAARKRASLVPPYRLNDAWKRWITQARVELDDWDTHTVIQNLRLCDVLELPRHYDVVVPESGHAPETLNALLPFPWRTTPYAVFHMVPLRFYKRWTIQGWQDVARHLAANGLPIVIVGGSDKEEADYVQAFLRTCPAKAVDLTGKLKFSETAKLIGSCKLYVGLDTAVTHLAAATGAPTVALYGPTNPVKWAPWPLGFREDRNPFERTGTQHVGNVVLVQGVGDCVPCHEEGCDHHRLSNSRCLEALDATVVIRAIKQAIG
ncbi:MAG: glycosyltransferase family 9 protein [Desulfobacterota bacterium]|jgi:heptosyltransferase-3|nr:glycosyltransferase family 9 protein [Thermodesulfobacteriota bacterium]